MLNQYSLATIIVGILAVITISLFVSMIIGYSISIYKTIMLVMKNKANYRKKMKKVEEMKANGELHEWVSIPIMGEEVYVCSKTMYCPSKEGFVSKDYFDEVVANKADQEQYVIFRDNALEEICETYNLSMDELNEMVKEISEIPTKYVRTKVNNGDEDDKLLQ